MASNSRRIGSLTDYIAAEPKISHMASNYRRFSSLTDCMAKRAERQPYGNKLAANRFTYPLHPKTGGMSAIWRATPGDSAPLPSTFQSEPNVSNSRAAPDDSVHLPAVLQRGVHVSNMASNSRGFGSLTGCIAKGEESQPYGDQLPVTRFTYTLHSKASRTSAK
jgi:hypothetical protein